MGERLPRQELDEVSDLQYAVGAAANVLMRWRLYERAETSDPRYDVIDSVLTGDEIILDAGCGSGLDLLRLATKQPAHNGALMGLEISSDAYGVPLLKAHRSRDAPVELMIGDTVALPLPDMSVDVVLAMFMLYHVADPGRTLQEFRRVLRPDGTLIVGTSGSYNKPAHRLFEKRLAKEFGRASLPQFNSRFSGMEAAELLKTDYYIDPIYSRNWRSRFLIYHTEDDCGAGHTADQDSNYQIYRDSLMTMKANFIPPVQSWVWNEAFERCVAPVVRNEIDKTGYFTEIIDRRYFVCHPKN